MLLRRNSIFKGLKALENKVFRKIFNLTTYTYRVKMYYKRNEFWEATEDWACSNRREDRRSTGNFSRKTSIWKTEEVVGG
jgi:hypothetical protein